MEQRQAPPMPDYPRSTLIESVSFARTRNHKGDGDMWPLTWADDGNIYAGAGDNLGSPMNFWRVEGGPPGNLFLVDNLPIDPRTECDYPAHPTHGIKPAGLVCLGGVLYFAVEQMHYGVAFDRDCVRENHWRVTEADVVPAPSFVRQLNTTGWIITSDDYGKTWNKSATPKDFFTGRLASVHFLQFGRNYAGARDDYVYAYFPAADDGNSYWENGDCILLGRTPRDSLLDRGAWEFFTGTGADGSAGWDSDDSKAAEVFRYPSMTGENHVAYNKGIGRYIMGNYGFMTPDGVPRPYHQHSFGTDEETRFPSQLTLFEAPEPWGPWSLFHVDNDWGMYGGYQPNFPTKWMSDDGKGIWMVSSGSCDDYNFTTQKLTLSLRE